MAGMGKILLYKLAGMLVITASVAAAWLILDYRQFRNTPLHLPEPGMSYMVEPGSNLKVIAARLAENGVIQRPGMLVWMARWQGKAQRIQAGEYALESGMLPEAFIDMLVAGRVKQYAVTLVEGWNFAQVMSALDNSTYLTHDLIGEDAAGVMAALGYPGEHPEGRFYPDTYNVTRGTSDHEVLRRAYDAMRVKLAEEWAARAEGLPYQSPYQALIMASIIEKETGLAEERGAIAGVFTRRLEKNMLLQTDPTIIYGLGENFDGNIRRKHLRMDNPYNTYRRKGLPPTPIAMPGGAALHAAMHPEPGTALYFVARGDGGHVFSDTLAQHNEAVIKYQLNGKRKAFSSLANPATSSGTTADKAGDE